VYIGNVPGHRYDNTYCPSCGNLLIRRIGLDVQLIALRDGYCPECSYKVAGVWN
jgi:pyruvate formate lyase activating enzyme